MSAPRILTASEIVTAKRMYGGGAGVTPIARKLGVSRHIVQRALKDAGIQLRKASATPARDTTACLPIGKLPPGHHLAPIDEAILRERAFVRRW